MTMTRTNPCAHVVSGLAIAIAVMVPTAGAAQTPAGAAASATQEPQKPRSQVPTLGRPTKADDPAPILDFFAYFKGTWNFTWDYPDSPLGPAGAIEGSTAYTQVDEHFFEATTTATGQAGAVTIRESIGYLKDSHTLSRSITDSRGFSYLQIGTVAGDLGGHFTIRLESAPFVYQGQTIRVRSVMRLLSPLNYRTQTSISVDGGPFTNYGNTWWRKEGASQ